MGITATPELVAPDYNSKPVTKLRNPVVNAISLVNKGANKKRFFLFKSEDSPVDNEGFYIDASGNVTNDPNELDKFAPLLKAGPSEDEWRACYCIVAVPGEEDAQKDVWDAPEIQDAAHEYLKKSRLINYMHKDFDAVGDLVQSAIAPVDMEIGGEQIPAGTWYIAIEPYPEMKKMIETGEITGVSVQGSSRREAVDPHLATDVAKAGNDYTAPVPPRPVTQVPPNADKDRMDVPIGTEGPGITRLQHILGIEETGEFDEATATAVVEWMTAKGVPGRPTLATIKLILAEGEVEEGPEEPVNEVAPEVVAPAEKSASQEEEATSEEALNLWKSKGVIYHYAGDSSKTPLWVKEVTNKDVLVEFPPTEEGAEAEVANVGLDEIYKCDNPDTHVAELAKKFPVKRDEPYNPATDVINTGIDPADTVGPDPENMGTDPNDVGPDSTPEQLKAVVQRAVNTGNELLAQHLSSAYNINSTQDLENYNFSQDEIWGMVSRFVLGRKEKPVSESMEMQPARRTDKTVYPEGSGFSMQKTAIFDYHTPTSLLPTKSGEVCGAGAIVELPGGKTAQVSSVNVNKGTFAVEVLPKKGDNVTKDVKASTVTLVDADPANGRAQNSFDFTLQKANEDEAINPDENEEVKAPSSVKVGDIVESKGIAGEVVEVTEDEVTYEYVTKAGSEVKKTVSKSDIKVIGKLEKAGRAGGSMGGHHPKKHGKIRFIVRSFGKWAGGKHRICVARLRAEHPEVFKGNEDAGCAWLKDQWMGTTKWRSGRKGGKLAKFIQGDSKFAEVYNGELMKGVDEGTLDSLFGVMCVDMGLDHEEIISHMDNEEGFDSFLDDLLQDNTPDELGQESDSELAKKFIEIAKSDGSVDEKLALIKNVMEATEVEGKSGRTANNKDFLAAMTALQLGIADAVENEDLEKQAGDLDMVMADFGRWLHKFTESGYYVDFSEVDEVEEVEKEVTAPPVKLNKRGTNMGKRLEKAAPAEAPEASVDASLDLKGATVQTSDGKKWIVLSQEGEMAKLRSGAETIEKSVGEVTVVRQPLAKNAGMDGIAGKPKAAAAPPEKKKRLPFPPKAPAAEGEAPEAAPGRDRAEVPSSNPAPAGAKPMTEAPDKAPEGAATAGGAGTGGDSAVARLLALARKRKEAAGGGEVEKTEAPVEAVAKSAAPLTAAKLERLRETRSFLESVLNYDGTTAEAAPAEVAEAPVEDTESTTAEASAEAAVEEAPAAEAVVEADGNENTNDVEKDIDTSNAEDMEVEMSDSEITMSQVVDAVNGLGDEVDTILTRLEEFSSLGPKLDHIGDLAKSLDATERIDSLEQAVERLAETVGLLNSTAEAVEEVSKRLTSLEGQPGSSTAAAVDDAAKKDEVIEKSAPEEPVLFQRAYGSIF